MKITAGFISDIPSKPSTGLVSLLAKHRIQLDPSFNLRAGRGKLLALARALIEALGGKDGENGWEVDINLGASVERVEALETKVLALENQLESTKKDYESVLLVVQGVTAQYNDARDMISELLRRVEKLESVPKRAKSAEAKPDEAK
jgi:BMFP domain-containing protein YqiC